MSRLLLKSLLLLCVVLRLSAGEMDPTAPLAFTGPGVTGSHGEAVAGRPVLQALLYRQGRWQAIVNGDLLTGGQRWRNFDVLRIDERGVTLRQEQTTLQLSLDYPTIKKAETYDKP